MRVEQQLDDVITLHLMEDGEARTDAEAGDGTKEGRVLTLLGEAGEDSADANGLDTGPVLLFSSSSAMSCTELLYLAV
eukprot:2260142-Rhodomonas_salina.2